tara:strand:+ start:268 stop:471 length:204 start_codon:yes stop_codon:yes gene_type:complete
MATSKRKEVIYKFLEQLAALEKAHGIYVADAELIDGFGEFEGYLERSEGDLQVVVDGEVLIEFRQSD